MAANSSNGANGHANGGASYAEKHGIAPHFIGGNRLENAPASKVKDFVAQHDGHTVITNVSRESPLRILFALASGSHATPRSSCQVHRIPQRPRH